MSALEDYARKRDFAVTPEPEAALGTTTGSPGFAVQKHDATRLHFDFRLEWDGVLWSWAVTKGPSRDPGEKRLAVRTEDHPVSYATFEGTIPQDEYGGGTVMLWDSGTWEPLHDPADGLKKGKLHFRLHGARMTGGWALVRMRGQDKRENWLLVKDKDDHAQRGPDGLTNRYRRSVATGRTMAEIARDKPQDPAGQDGRTPAFRTVQLATLQDAPPEGEAWWHEMKFDGYRCLIALGKGGPRFFTRNGKDWTDRFAALAEGAAAIDCDSALIDAEVIAGEAGGDFSTLQKALKRGDRLTAYAFDLLHLDGTDLVKKPLSERRALLEGLLSDQPPRGSVRLSPILDGTGHEVRARICDAGGEGIVSKKVDAPYRQGRAKAWIKSKCVRRAEFVILGHVPSDKAGRPFSSLVLGSYESGALVYRGRVGTGFDAGTFDDLMARMKPLARKTSPLAGKPPAETRDAQWITPKLVAEIAYTEFTSDGIIRHGAFQALREDKDPREVGAGQEAAVDRASPERGADGTDDGSGGAGTGDGSGGGATSGKAQSDTSSGTAPEGRMTRHGIRISSVGREVFPKAGLTKGDVADYYSAAAGAMLAHAKDRPVSLLRHPEGIEGDGFFQKHAGKGFPDAIGTLAIEEKDGTRRDYMALSGAASVLGAVQMGTLEFHIWGARRDRLERPDRLVFDLDPDEGLGFDDIRAAATEIRDALDGFGLEAGVMVTGGKGLHVIAPLRRIAGWDTVKGFARTFASALAERHPDRYTATMSKRKRRGRIFIDWLRNERGATAIAPFSVRARPGAPVAVPVGWDELDGLDRANGFDTAAALERAGRQDPLAGIKATKGIDRAAVEALEDWIEG